MRTTDLVEITGQHDKIIRGWASKLPMESVARERSIRRWTVGDVVSLLHTWIIMERGFSEELALAFAGQMSPHLVRLMADPAAKAWLIGWRDDAAPLGWSFRVFDDNKAALDVMFEHRDASIFSVHQMLIDALAIVAHHTIGKAPEHD